MFFYVALFYWTVDQCLVVVCTHKDPPPSLYIRWLAEAMDKREDNDNNDWGKDKTIMRPK